MKIMDLDVEDDGEEDEESAAAAREEAVGEMADEMGIDVETTEGRERGLREGPGELRQLLAYRTSEIAHDAMSSFQFIGVVVSAGEMEATAEALTAIEQSPSYAEAVAEADGEGERMEKGKPQAVLAAMVETWPAFVAALERRGFRYRRDGDGQHFIVERIAPPRMH